MGSGRTREHGGSLQHQNTGPEASTGRELCCSGREELRNILVKTNHPMRGTEVETKCEDDEEEFVHTVVDPLNFKRPLNKTS